MKASLMIILISLGLQIAYAGGETGGALAVKIKRQVFLYDFEEAGMNDDVHIPNAEFSYPLVDMTILHSKLFSARVNKLVNQKLWQIYNVSPEVALVLAAYIEHFQWVPARNLKQTNDKGHSPVNRRGVFNLARYDEREGLIPRISIETIDGIWKATPDSHKVGTIFHEAWFRLARIYYAGRNSSEAVRSLNSWVFKASFQNADSEKLKSMLESTVLVKGEAFATAAYISPVSWPRASMPKLLTEEGIFRRKFLLPELMSSADWEQYQSEAYRKSCNKHRSQFYDKIEEILIPLSDLFTKLEQKTSESGIPITGYPSRVEGPISMLYKVSNKNTWRHPIRGGRVYKVLSGYLAAQSSNGYPNTFILNVSPESLEIRRMSDNAFYTFFGVGSRSMEIPVLSRNIAQDIEQNRLDLEKMITQDKTDFLGLCLSTNESTFTKYQLNFRINL